ncbi:hypothetical protein N7478_001753 [Penicillium angulare]|uniref:uncharacterized protein n=1 Tax=Penicillium angulare TaxID=116970 RepID=UPI002540BE54|nr:uncharacterized protein N7478_001753 [Penicillium angulare]KAJ5288723.1 hypothetical protein N7478_001753 [Penicillium angulare]
MASTFPFAYGYGVKVGALSSSNLYFDWCNLYKSLTSHLLPPAECHTKLLKALRIIDESRKRSMARNVGVRFQKKWVQREQVEESPDLRQGWIRKTGVEAPEAFTKNDQNTLELETLKELGLIQAMRKTVKATS